MRAASLCFVLAVAMAGAAIAQDFVVVSSTEPGLRPGQAIDGGAHLMVGPGHSVTLIRPSGEVLALQGAAGGVTAPAGRADGTGTSFAALKSLFVPPQSGRAFGARRGFCPGPEVLDNVGAIARASQAGCKADARAAFQAYLMAHGVSREDAEKLYKTSVAQDTDE